MRGVHLYTLPTLPQAIPTYSSEYNALAATWASKPSTTVAVAFDTMIEAMKTAGSWSKGDIFQFFSTHTNSNGEALKNWLNPGTFDPTKVESPTFTAYQGFTGVETPRGYISCNYNPATQAINFALNSATIIVGIGNNVSDTSGFGHVVSSIENRINGYTGGDVRVSVNCDFADTQTNTVGGGKGHFGGIRRASNGFYITQNTSISGLKSETSDNIPNAVFYAGTANSGGTPEHTGKQVRYVYAGSALTDQEYTDTINAIETCLDTLGTGLIAA